MNKIYFSLAACAVAVMAAGNARAAGFEKSVMWSGKYAGVGGNAVSSVSGSQSIYFNPAGLASPGDVSLNYSPSWINVDSHMISAGRVDESRPGVLPFAGVFASYGIGKFGFGAGFYAAGGEKGIYPNLDLTIDSGRPFTTSTPTLETDLEISEYSLGGGYEVIPGLKVGGAWRIVRAVGTLSSLSKTVTNTAYVNLAVVNAKQTQYDGYRLGVQYEEPENHRWGVGAAYRSSVKFDAPGSGSGSTIVIPLNVVTPASVLDTRVGLIFPDAYYLGGHYAVNDAVKVFAGFDYAKYSKDNQVSIVGTFNSAAISAIPLNWKDMWNLRFGVEYTGIQKVALRAGYVRTTQVTSSTDAKGTLPPPGPGNAFQVGAGYAIMPSLSIDGALEYAKESGDGSMTMPTGTTKELLAGVTTKTEATAYAIHTGLTFKF